MNNTINIGDKLMIIQHDALFHYGDVKVGDTVFCSEVTNSFKAIKINGGKFWYCADRFKKTPKKLRLG